MNLVEPGSAAATTQNILRSTGLFRAGLAADVLMIALDVGVAVGFYALLRKESRPLAVLAAALRLVQASILGANLMNMADALNWAAIGADASSLASGTAETMVLSSMELHRVTYDLGLIFFGLSCLVLGRLIWTSSLVPRPLGLGLSISGVIYIVGSLSVVLAPQLSSALDPFYGFTVLAELSIAGWLTFKGAWTGQTARQGLHQLGGLAASVLALSVTACGAESSDETQPDEPGEGLTFSTLGWRGAHNVGYRILDGAGSSLTVKAWYPTDEQPNDIEYEVTFQADYYGTPTGAISGTASRDAGLAATEGPLPVVVFSHGFGLNPEWYSHLTEHLASHGFLVLAPEHPEGDWDATVVEASFDRPAKIRQTIDMAERLADEGDFEGQIDVSNVAVVGHSYGGYTALSVGGARFDVETLAEQCKELDPMNPKTFLCAPFTTTEALERFHLDADAPSPVRDERVAAVVSIAGDAYVFGANGLSALTVPTLSMGGTGDNYSPWDWGSELVYEATGSEQAALVGLVDADHMIAVNDCSDMPWTDALPAEFGAILCEDPAWKREEAHEVLRRFTTAFLFDTLKGSESARAILSTAKVDQDGVEYRVRW